MGYIWFNPYKFRINSGSIPRDSEKKKKLICTVVVGRRQAERASTWGTGAHGAQGQCVCVLSGASACAIESEL